MDESGVVTGEELESPVEPQNETVVEPEVPAESQEEVVVEPEVPEESQTEAVTEPETPAESQGEAVTESETESGEEVTEETAEPDVMYEELLNAINSMNSTPDYEIDYTSLLQQILAEQQMTNQYLTESIKVQQDIADNMKLVNTCIYVFFIFLVGFFGYKIMSWLI